MNSLLKNAIDSVFEKLDTLSDEEFQRCLSDAEYSDITLSFVELFSFCSESLGNFFAGKFNVSTMENFLFVEIDYQISIATTEAANDFSYLMAA